MNPCLYSDNARRIAKQKADAEARREELKQNLADCAAAIGLALAIVAAATLLLSL